MPEIGHVLFCVVETSRCDDNPHDVVTQEEIEFQDLYVISPAGRQGLLFVCAVAISSGVTINIFVVTQSRLLPGYSANVVYMQPDLTKQRRAAAPRLFDREKNVREHKTLDTFVSA